MKLANVPGTSQTLVIGALLVGSIGIPRAIQLIRQRAGSSRPAGGAPAPGPEGTPGDASPA
jgi:rhamnose transport system permease protein